MSGELAIPADRSVPIRSLEDVRELGKVMVASGFFRDSQDAAKAAVKILAGRELGIPPVAAMRGIHVVEGKVELSGTMIAALIKRSGRYDYRVVENSDTSCTVEFFQAKPGTTDAYESIGKTTWTIEDAKRAGLAGKDNWRKYPRAMLFARAIAEGARQHVPDIFDGAVYAEGEVADEVVEGEVVDSSAAGSDTGALPSSSAEPTAADDDVPGDGDTGANEAEGDESSDPSGEDDAARTDGGDEDPSASPADTIAQLGEQLGWKPGRLLRFAREKVGKHVTSPNWSALSDEDAEKLVAALREEVAG